ncbi:MAG: 5'/3'-nucleotidase SurE [Candidatus Dechloromonas phosphoritropha]|jgi:5'-nucleotidase|nr:5'/3'-nucleotidase SurE [Candidatus Dechloromonas phosphoritropha]MBP8786028.1 5'/3'-nucleotidase SurE [Azonexus sp.]MBP9229211.1 5'/3'-nucleotidase SurE [Azonexus sp.]
MRILLSNDDGYFAPGILALAEALDGLGEIVVVAPEQNRSAASNSLTLDRPVFLKQAANGFYFVNGTPSDCVHLAVSGMLDYMPDIIVSGINHGANMGDDTIYSGTVAAATEGFLLGIPSIALSLTSFEGSHFNTAGRIARELVERFFNDPIRDPVLLNVNVPDIPYADLRGTEVTRLGRRHKAEPVVKMRSPRNDTVYWVGAAGAAAEAGPGTDFNAIERGCVSITPLQVDLTHTARLQAIANWLR